MSYEHAAELTTALAGEGVRLLNFFRLADTELGHVARVLAMADLPQGARVADLGCGTGEFARLASILRDDLSFTLVNNNEWQLSQCPQQHERVLADMACTGLPPASCDAVVLAYAVGHGDVVELLREARRILAPGGVLVVHDMHAYAPEVKARFKADFDYQLHNTEAFGAACHIIGFDSVAYQRDEFVAPGATVEAVVRGGHLDGVEHGVHVLRKSEREDLFAGRNVALHFSGGKDSLACLYLLEPWLTHHVRVYWVNTGDACPETEEVVRRVQALLPSFVEVRSDVQEWRRANGTPSDLVPANSHTLGLLYGMGVTKLSSRFDCCWNNIMAPMHQRMLGDNIDVVVRGTKRADTGTVPHEGWAEDYYVMLPIREWSHRDVFAYLEKVGAPNNPIYKHFKSISAPECIGCTAWWDDGKAAYLAELHPERLGEYRMNLRNIKAALKKHLSDLESELEG